MASGLVPQVCGFVLFSTTLWVGAGEKIVFSDSYGKAEGSKPVLTSEEISRRFNFIKRGATPDFSSGEIASPSVQPNNNWRWLFMHMMPCPLFFAFPIAGKSIPARIAIMAITTSNSIRVNPLRTAGNLEMDR